MLRRTCFLRWTRILWRTGVIRCVGVIGGTGFVGRTRVVRRANLVRRTVRFPIFIVRLTDQAQLPPDLAPAFILSGSEILIRTIIFVSHLSGL